jgi:TonB-dependent SusC/RagA subfamily outer membrane receptor
MKTLKFRIHIFLFFYTIAIIAGCSSAKNTTNTSHYNSPDVIDDGYQQVLAKDTNQSYSTVKPNEDRKSNASFGDMLQRLPGVQVTGQGRNIRVKVSGTDSFMSNTDPLFVLNGSSVGTDVSTILSTVNPNDISSLRVLKGPDASIYGTRGANGVILIRTKK